MAQKYNSSVVFERDSNYILRCISAVFGLSGAGNPMLTFEYEIVSPEVMTVAGEEFTIAGLKMKTWQVVQTMVDGVVDVNKTARNKEGLTKLYKAFEFDGEINPENPDTSAFINKTVYAMLSNDAKEQRKSPTAEQLAKGQKQGDIMLNPKTKQPLTYNGPKIGEVFGLAEVGGSGAV